MRRAKLRPTAALGGLLAITGAAWAQSPDTDPLAHIGHIVVIFEENRSFDNLFGKFPGANGLNNALDAPRQIGPDGKPYATLPPVIDTLSTPPGPDRRFPADLPNAPFAINPFVPPAIRTGDLVHRFYQEQTQINGGLMNRFAQISDSRALSMGYFDINGFNLWQLAREFSLGDAMFHSAFGGSFLNHTFLVCSCAYRWPNAPDALVAKLDAAGNMVTDGQVSPDGYVINTSYSVHLHPPDITDPAQLVPPQTMPHIGDRLDAKRISWKWYSGGYDDAMAGHAAPNFQFHHQPLAYFQNLAPGTPAQKAHLQDYQDLLRDIEQNTLPQMVFYKPLGDYDEHPGYADVADGDRHLGELVAKLRASPAYADMLILITYDENGGQWDHVPPPRRDKWGPGSRVPLVAVGPMVRRGYIDHTPYDFNAILRTIEARFGLEPLTDADRNAYTMRNLLE